MRLGETISYFYAVQKTQNTTTVSDFKRRNRNISEVYWGIGTQLLTIRSSPVRQQVYSWFDYLLFWGVTLNIN